MRKVVDREYEVFCVSGKAENFLRTYDAILLNHPTTIPSNKFHVYAGWPITALPKCMWDRVVYHAQETPFIITRENNRALRDIWGRGHDAVLVEDDVVVVTPGVFDRMAWYAELYRGLCLLQPGIIGFNYGNVTTRPNTNLLVHREPRHFPIICCYFPQELEHVVGYYDEQIDTYGCDDNDYSLRCKKAAVLQLALPSMLVRHLYESSVFAEKNLRDEKKSKEYYRAKWGHYPGDPRLD